MIINIFLGTFFALYLMGLMFTLGFMLKEWATETKGFYHNFLMLAGLMAWPLVLGFYTQTILQELLKKEKDK